MPTYVQLLNLTEQGIETIEDTPGEVEDAKQLIESLGGEFKDFYLTFGQYDGVAIAEFPDDETCAQFALAMSRDGSGTTETLKAFSLDEFHDIVKNIPG